MPQIFYQIQTKFRDEARPRYGVIRTKDGQRPRLVHRLDKDTSGCLLIAKSRFYTDSNFPDRKQARERDESATVLDTSVRLQGRFAVQTMLLQCMQDQKLDALMSPMSTVPPRKLTSPREPAVNGRTPIGWSLIGQQGFPAITVPAGFTTAVWDRVIDVAEGNGGTRLIGPVPASLPVGVDFLAPPFAEPLLFRIASAYEAATRHRRPPPDFGPVEERPAK